MFSRLSADQLREAEHELAAGRLEEAARIAARHRFTQFPRAVSFLDKLVAALLDRGQESLLSRRFAQAAADFELAAPLGRQAEAVQQWRRRAKDAIENDARVASGQRQALDEARACLARGSLAGAADAQARAPLDNTEAAAVRDAIDVQHDRAQAAAKAAAAALDSGELLAAVKACRRAAMLDAKSEEVASVFARLATELCQAAKDDFQAGRLGRARQCVAALAELGVLRPERAEIDQAMQLAGQAAQALTKGQYAEAAVLMGRLTSLGFDAPWVATVQERLDSIEANRRALLEGPLGLLSATADAGRADSPVREETQTQPHRAKPRVREAPLVHDQPYPAAGVPKRLLLRIDGVGSFVLLRGDRIGIGRMGSRSADLELVSDLSERQADLIRAGEDYFIAARGGVELAGRPVDYALLQDGDRVRLGRRVRLTFRRPSRKSPTALFDLGEGVRTVGDCRRVILWSGPVLMGSARESHIPLPPTLAPLILIERGGSLWVHPAGARGDAVALPLGAQVDIGSLRLSVQEWASGSGLGRVVA